MKSPNEKQDRPKEIVFFVDKQQYKTTEREMTVRAVLLKADENPDETTLVLQHGSELRKYATLDEVVRLENGMHFVVYHNGPTPVS